MTAPDLRFVQPAPKCRDCSDAGLIHHRRCDRLGWGPEPPPTVRCNCNPIACGCPATPNDHKRRVYR